MKTWLTKWGSLTAGVVIFTTGCSLSRPVTSQKLGRLTAPGEEKGYVQFLPLSRGVPIPILQFDEAAKPRLIAIVGPKPGQQYRYRTGEDGALVAQRLQIALPPGDYLFMVERDGDVIRIPVEKDRVTRVEIDEEIIEDADAYRIYRLETRVLAPIPFEGEKHWARSR